MNFICLGSVISFTCFMKDGNPARQIYKMLTFRECEYLELIRRNSIPIFGEVIRALQYRKDMNAPQHNSFDYTMNNENMPMTQDMNNMMQNGIPRPMRPPPNPPQLNANFNGPPPRMF